MNKPFKITKDRHQPLGEVLLGDALHDIKLGTFKDLLSALEARFWNEMVKFYTKNGLYKNLGAQPSHDFDGGQICSSYYSLYLSKTCC